jgi:hypothetical protein
MPRAPLRFQGESWFVCCVCLRGCDLSLLGCFSALVILDFLRSYIASRVFACLLLRTLSRLRPAFSYPYLLPSAAGVLGLSAPVAAPTPTSFLDERPTTGLACSPDRLKISSFNPRAATASPTRRSWPASPSPGTATTASRSCARRTPWPPTTTTTRPTRPRALSLLLRTRLHTANRLCPRCLAVTHNNKASRPSHRPLTTQTATTTPLPRTSRTQILLRPLRTATHRTTVSTHILRTATTIATIRPQATRATRSATTAPSRCRTTERWVRVQVVRPYMARTQREDTEGRSIERRRGGLVGE